MKRQPGEPGYKPSDAGRRLSDTYNLHRLADPYGSIGKWFMARLNDGSPVDGELYPSKHSAANHAKNNERYYVFVRIMPKNMSPEEADGMLSIYRKAHEAGIQFTDPDHANGGPDLINRLTKKDQYNQIAAMFGHGKPSNITYGKG